MDNKGFQRLVFISLTAALAVTILLIAVIGWEFFSFQKTDEKIQKRNFIFVGNTEKILFYDEMLTMSAKMAAATGDIKYEKRYNKAEKELDELIKKTIAIFQEASEVADCIKETENANRKLVEMERKAFALVRNGRSSEALEIFNGTEYNEQKRIYSQGIDKAVEYLKTELKDSLREAKKTRLFFFATSLLGGIVVFISWILSIWAIRKWEKERAEFEKTLGKSEEKYRTLIETTNTGYLIVDLQGRVVDANSEYVKLSGHHSLDEILGRSVIEWTAEYDLERNAEEVKKCGLKGFVRNLEIDYVDKNGNITPIEINATVIETPEGKKILSLCRDITDRKRMEERLAKVNECFLNFGKNALENINHLTALCGESFGATAALYNRLDKGTLCSWGQWNVPSDYNPADNPEGHICYDIINKHSDEVFVLRNLLESPYAKTDPYVTRYKLQSYIGKAVKFSGAYVGSLCVVFQQDFVPSEEDKKLIGILASAIGVEEERKHAEDALMKSEEFLSIVFSSMSDGMVVTDLNGKILRVNQYFCKLLGYKGEELIGKYGTKYYPKTNKNNIKKSFAKFKEEQSDNTIWEVDLFAKNGELIPASSRRTLLKDKNGNFFAVMAVFRDMREMRLLQEQLFQAEKLSATGRLISGVAHELNNPLTGIIGYSELLLKDSSHGAKTAERLKIIYEQSNRCKNIISNLLKFSRKHETTKTSVSINEVIDNTLALNQYEMESGGIKVIKELKRGISKIAGDLNQLQSVILNLTQNAHHSLLEKQDGERSLKIKTEQVDDKIIIEVSDTGTGISEENIKKIFDPFFTTKDVGKGTGLGLSICHGIVRDHGGNISVKSRIGEGTTFTIELPALSKPQETHL